MLYSTREKLSEGFLNLLNNLTLEHKTQCEKDINRTNSFINEQDFRSEFLEKNSQYAESKDKFEFTKSKIKDQAEVNGLPNEAAEYLATLMTTLYAQTFSALPLVCSSYLKLWNCELQEALQQEGMPLKGKNMHAYELHFEKNKVVYKFNTHFLYGSEDEPKLVKRTINYTFYLDRTMQASMDNPADQEEGVKFFAFLTSLTQEKAIELLCLDGVEKDYPFCVLGMNCDQEKCKIVTAIEKLSKANPYTVARLIDKNYISNQIPTHNLHMPQDIYDKLSDEAKANINEIGNALIARCGRSKFAAWSGDIIDIIVNVFLEILHCFDKKLGESAVGSKKFDEFCEKLKVEEAISEDQRSTFTKKFLEAKERLGDERRIGRQ